MSNLFKKLACFGEEDFFTASLALFLDSNPEFRNAFLNWIEPLVDERLTDFAWDIKIQYARRSQFGDAILDMAFVNPRIELWFEHKVGAILNRYSTETGDQVDQLQKYLDAAARTMQGIKNADEDVDWPENRPREGHPRVILFFISRNRDKLNRSVYEGRIYGSKPFGLAFPEDNRQLRWRDFHPSAESALSSTLAGSDGVFQAELTRQFLMYWRSIRGLWKQTTYDLEWEELLPPDQELGPERTAGFDNYFLEIDRLITDHFGWTKPTNYKGKSRETAIHCNQLEHLTITPIRRVDEEIGCYEPPLGLHVLKLRFRFSSEIPANLEFQGSLSHESWFGVISKGTRDGKLLLDLFVQIRNWDGALTDRRKSREVGHAFLAGLHMIRSLVGITIDGLDDV